MPKTDKGMTPSLQHIPYFGQDYDKIITDTMRCRVKEETWSETFEVMVAKVEGIFEIYNSTIGSVYDELSEP